MNIDDLTIKQARELAALFCDKQVSASQPFEIGLVYLIRTVTMIDVGRVIAVGEHELVLEDAAWIADTGRFSDALKKCEFNEVEPFPDGKVIIGRGSIIDAVPVNEGVCDGNISILSAKFNYWLHFKLARLFGKCFIRSDPAHEKDMACIVTGYRYRGITYITKVEHK